MNELTIRAVAAARATVVALPWRLGLCAALVTACIAGRAVAWQDMRGFPTDLPIGKIETIDGRWQPDDCTGSGRKQVVCTVTAYLACDSFFRTDLCERVGLYPTLVEEQDYKLYGERVVEADWVAPDFEQYRIVEFRNFDERYSPPLLIVYIEIHDCWRTKRPPLCSKWVTNYLIISSLDTQEPDVVASGGVIP